MIIFQDLACGKPASILNSGKFTSVNMDNLEFLRDVHSWRWTWACGKRLLIIGLGVSILAVLHVRSSELQSLKHASCVCRCSLAQVLLY